MHGYRNSIGPAGDWFPEPGPRLEPVDAGKTGENAPARVLSEMAVVCGTALAVVLLIDVAVFLIGIPMHAFHMG